MKKVAVIFGTRPEAIKLAPVILALRSHPEFTCRVCVTAQHREMLDQVLELFSIVPDVDLNLMVKNQTLAELTSRAITHLDEYMKRDQPDLVIVQGDTTTTFCGGLTAFYNHIPIAHVEAGLRTGNLQAPWPEEANRAMTSRIANLHFPPTELNKQNLLKEDISESLIRITGNTVIDALLMVRDKVLKSPPIIPNLPEELQPACFDDRKRVVLITGHRRESFGEGFKRICTSISELADKYPDVDFIYPVHLNPNVRQAVSEILGTSSHGTGECQHSNVHLIEPITYLPFVALMNMATVILTDSGGVQEEAPSLGKPVLVMRDKTERPEAVHAGTVRLVGTDKDKIVSQVSLLLENSEEYAGMSKAHNPYGDGKAAQRIVSAIEQYLL